MTDPYGPYEPLEERLGGRASFEAHQKSEAERTARVLAYRRAQRREVLMTVVKALVVVAILVAIGFITARALP